MELIYFNNTFAEKHLIKLISKIDINNITNHVEKAFQLKEYDACFDMEVGIIIKKISRNNPSYVIGDQYQILFDSAPIGIVAIRQSIILMANNYFAKMYGYDSIDDILHHPIQKFQPSKLR